MLSRSLSALVKNQINVIQRLRATRDVQPIHTQVSAALLAGHSKWSNIRHVKALKDGQRAALFVRLARQIRLAVQEGGSPDPAYNSHLKGVVEQALRQRMPMASIQNNLKKSKEKGDIKEHIFQARYLQKVFIVIVTYTDNVTEVRKELSPAVRRSGGTMHEDNYVFEDFGLVEATLDKATLGSDNFEDRVTEDAIECGIEDVEVVSPDTRTVNFTCNPSQLMSVRRNLEGRGYKVDNAEHVFLPKNVVKLTAEELKSYNTALQKLRNIQAVENIYDNIEHTTE